LGFECRSRDDVCDDDRICKQTHAVNQLQSRAAMHLYCGSVSECVCSLKFVVILFVLYLLFVVICIWTVCHDEVQMDYLLYYLYLSLSCYYLFPLLISLRMRRVFHPFLIDVAVCFDLSMSCC